jgi:hypothetical protein
VVCARREANRSSSVVASSATIASVPRALGLEWALKWRSITKSESSELSVGDKIAGAATASSVLSVNQRSLSLWRKNSVRDMNDNLWEIKHI